MRLIASRNSWPNGCSERVAAIGWDKPPIFEPPVIVCHPHPVGWSKNDEIRVNLDRYPCRWQPAPQNLMIGLRAIRHGVG
jgi:hypothetical protein